MPRAFVGGTVIDGTGAAPLAEAAVVVADGRIVSVGPAAGLERDRLEIVDVVGKHVIPGLMDANVHLLLHCDPEVLLRYEPGGYDELVLESAQVALKAGITTVFDTWGPLEALKRVRDRIASGEASGSRVYIAGNIIGNGGPWSSDFFPPYGQHLNPATVEAVNAEWEQGVGSELTWMPAADVGSAVRDYVARSGIDFVKYASSAHAHFRFLALSPDAQRAVVEEAHAAGMTAQACALTTEALRVAIAAGVDFLQHGDTTGRHPMPEDTLELIVERQLPCIVMLRTERHVEAAHESKHGIYREVVRAKDQNGRRLIEAGAKLMLATDGGVFGPYIATSPWVGEIFGNLPDVPINLGHSHLLWLRAAAERGMPAMAALLAATRNIADAYGKLDELGTLEPGKRADLLVLHGDPLSDPDNYGRIAHVVKDGAVVDRDLLPEQPVLTRKE
jgi:imidazolonepropionase-like amidohydrolase